MADFDIVYSNMLHNAAVKWGLEEMAGRPLIGLAPYWEDKGKGIIGNPYQPKQIPPVEVIQPERLPGNRIELFTFNGRWGFSLSVTCKTRNFCYGNFLKFCDPYPDRQAALEAAAAKIIEATKGDPKLTAWAKSLAQPKQIDMFELIGA